MSDISQEELRERLAALASGPWAQGVAAARRIFAPVDRIRMRAYGDRFVALDKLKLSPSNIRRNRRLAAVLRPHYAYKEAITSPIEIESRDALDHALTLPQLYELAVQTGYLPSEAVKQPARNILGGLLWSPAARNFVDAYDYVAVPMLAARVGISGLGAVEPPEPRANGAIRFAGFLAHLRAFYADPQIQAWTRFLDDYIEEPDEQGKLWRYLKGKLKIAPARTSDLLTGCQLFVTSMASMFHILDDDELGHFGLIHAYWLQKFFGYDMDDSGYVKNVELWGQNGSWARTVTTSPYVIPEGTDPEIAEIFRRQFEERVQLLEKTFAAVRALAKSARRGRILPFKYGFGKSQPGVVENY